MGEGFADVIIRALRARARPPPIRTATSWPPTSRSTRSSPASSVISRLARSRSSLAALSRAGVWPVGIGSMALRESTITEKFDYQMKLGRDQTQSAPEKAERAYLAAIGYRPGDVEGYEGLIDAYKADGSLHHQGEGTARRRVPAEPDRSREVEQVLGAVLRDGSSVLVLLLLRRQQGR
ncbi:MAG: hypothetical protein ACLTXI_00085 [Collinsella sp.]